MPPNYITSLPAAALAATLADINRFSTHILRRPLRPYQIDIARQITHAAIRRNHSIITAILPRQTGKNELLAHVTLYLLFLYQRVGATIIHAAPTYTPQALNALERVLELAHGHRLLKIHRRDNVISIGHARAIYISAQPRERPLVGLTASLALIIDEAQDIDPDYARRALEPMRAATSAPLVATGTARTPDSYLAQLERIATHRTRASWTQFTPYIPGYAEHVQQQIALLGTEHPIIKNEYECQDITVSHAYALDARRIALILNGDREPHTTPQPNTTYIATLDIATPGTHHDITVLAIHSIEDDQITTRHYWSTHGNVLDPSSPDTAALRQQLDTWKPIRIFVDATGIGAGVATILAAAGYPVSPFTFTPQSKSNLWDTWLALIETHRYHHYTPSPLDADGLRAIEQMHRVITTSSGRHIAWGIPNHVTWQHPITLQIEPLHDDHITVAAMSALAADLAATATTTTYNYEYECG